MPRIHILPPDVVNKIAAGEVIERPSSVVKELLDNAVDAGATQIHIDVAQGGRELIRVVDNGCGFEAEDLPLAFASHATSKLRDPDDLFSIRTMGFRGEALASIGSVSQVTLESRSAEASTGARIECQGGVLSKVEAWNGPTGTRIEVRNLFYNTPARRHFLKTQATEMGHITEAATRLALGVPRIGVKLTHNDRDVFEIPASSSLADRIRLCFGKEVSDFLLPIDQTHGPVRLRGFMADPRVERGHARMQYLFVNGRWIRDRTLGHAIQEAYHGLLMVGRYAVVFLFLDLPPDQVDVNVHPTKAEVRFRDSQSLHHLVRSTLRQQLQRGNLIPELKVPMQTAASSAFIRPGASPAPMAGSWALMPPQGRDAAILPFTPPPRRPIEPPTPAADMGQEFMIAPLEADTAPPVSEQGTLGINEPSVPDHDRPIGPATDSACSDVPPKVIQLHHAYLVLETAEGMLVIDQHALHERILFEQLKERVRTGQVESQRLLIPEPVDLPPAEASLILEHAEALAGIGFGLQDFGHGTILVTAYPAPLHRRSPAELLRRVVDHLLQSAKPPTREQLQNDLLALMACHAAIKAGDPLSQDEMLSLLQFRHLVSDTHHCPHGRPTSLFFSKQELDRQFRRIL